MNEQQRYLPAMKFFRSKTTAPGETFCRYLAAAGQDDRRSQRQSRRLARQVARNGHSASLAGFYGRR